MIRSALVCVCVRVHVNVGWVEKWLHRYFLVDKGERSSTTLFGSGATGPCELVRKYRLTDSDCTSRLARSSRLSQLMLQLPMTQSIAKVC